MEEYNIVIMGDIHGKINNLGQAIKNIEDNKDNYDLIVLNGDYLPYGDHPLDDLMMLTKYTLESAASISIPTISIPGSHEPKFYDVVAESLMNKYSNFKSISKNTQLENIIDNITLELFPGSGVQYETSRIDTSGHFKAKYDSESSNKSENKILITHDPPKCFTINGIDRSNYTFIEDTGLVPIPSNAGHESIRKKIIDENIPISIHGHIHEAGGKAIDLRDENETTLDQKLNYERINLNHGALLNGIYSTISVNCEKDNIINSSYEVININD